MATGRVDSVNLKVVRQAAEVIQKLSQFDPTAADQLAEVLKADPSGAARVCAEAAKRLGSLTEVAATSPMKGAGFFATTPPEFRALCAEVLTDSNPQANREGYFKMAEPVAAEAVA